MRGSDKHANLMQEGINYESKKFYSTGIGIAEAGNTKREVSNVLLTSCLTGLD